MKKHFSINHLVIYGLLILSACSTLKSPEKQPFLTSRYKKIDTVLMVNDSAQAKVKVEIRADIVPDAPQMPKSIFNLSGEGQKALIEAYSKMTKSADTLNQLIGSAIKLDDGQGTKNVIDYTSKNVSFTISVKTNNFYGNSSAKPVFGDRLENIVIRFKLDSKADSIKMKSWNQIKTQFGRFYAGSTGYTGSQQLVINPSVTIGAGSLSLGSYTGTNQYQETDTISQQIITSTGNLYDHEFTIEQNGSPKTTLDGNSTIQVALTSTYNDSEYVFELADLTKKRTINQADKVTVSIKKIMFPVLPGGIKKLTGILSFDYTLRHINNGDNTFSESDDEVTYYKGTITNPKPITILIDKDLKPIRYYVRLGSRYIKFRDNSIKDSRERDADAVFLSNDQVEGFINWLLSTVPNAKDKIELGKKYMIMVQDEDNKLVVLNNSISLNGLNIYPVR